MAQLAFRVSPNHYHFMHSLADTLGGLGVLDPSDENHNFIGQRETLRPVSMFRHPDGCIMLCYNGKL